MKKKIIVSIMTFASLLTVGCATKNDMNNNLRSVATPMSLDNNGENSSPIDQEQAMKIYKKYSSKIKKLYKKYGIEVRNLNESSIDSGFITRLMYLDEEGANDCLNSTWYGLIYDKNDNISEVGMLVEGKPDRYIDSTGNFSIKKTIYEDIGNIFFKNTSYKDDIEGAIDMLIKSDGSDISIFEYKNGFIEVSASKDKISMKINLFVK